MLRPLFGLAGSGPPPSAAALISDRAHFGNAAIAAVQVRPATTRYESTSHLMPHQSLLWQCEASNPADRVTTEALSASFAALIAKCLSRVAPRRALTARRRRYAGSADLVAPFVPQNPQIEGFVSLLEMSRIALGGGAIEQAANGRAVSAQRVATALKKVQAAHGAKADDADAVAGAHEPTKEQKDAMYLAAIGSGNGTRKGDRPAYYAPPLAITDWYFRMTVRACRGSHRLPNEVWRRRCSRCGRRCSTSRPVRRRLVSAAATLSHARIGRRQCV